MANQSTQYSQTLDSGNALYEFSPWLTNGQEFTAWAVGGSRTFTDLPTGGAFITYVDIWPGNLVSRTPTIANPPTRTSYSSGTSTQSFNPPVSSGSTKAVHTGSYGEIWRFNDTYYELSSATIGPRTATIYYYLDDPAEGAEGAQAMLMIAGGM